MPKISALDEIAQADDLDQFPIDDVSASTTKRMKLSGLVTWLQSKVKIIKASMIDFSTFMNNGSGIITLNTSTAGNFTGTSVRSSQTITIPAGCTKVLVIASVRLQSQVAAANDMISYIKIGSAVSGSGVITGVGTFAAGMSTMLGVLTVAPGTNTVELVCNGGQSTSVSNYTCLIIPQPD